MDTILDQAIRDLIFKVYGKCYIGKLKVKELNPVGYDVIIGLDREEYPLHIMAEYQWDKFLTFIEKELRQRHLQTTEYYKGYKIDPYEERRTYRTN